jgi:two-component system chemotaxis response regulator CheY
MVDPAPSPARRALVLDDSRAMRMLLKQLLGMAGFEVMEASNGLDALQCLQDTQTPDIVLVDWNMPEMNGLEFVQAVRAVRAYDDILLMMVTTEAECASVAMALEAGANEYLMKPFQHEAVFEKLQLLGLLR